MVNWCHFTEKARLLNSRATGATPPGSSGQVVAVVLISLVVEVLDFIREGVG